MTDRQAMRLTFGILIASLGLSALPAQAQVSPTHEGMLTETLGLNSANHSSGQILTANIEKLSKECDSAIASVTLDCLIGNLGVKKPNPTNTTAITTDCKPTIVPLPIPKPPNQPAPLIQPEASPTLQSQPANQQVPSIQIEPANVQIVQPVPSIQIEPVSKPIKPQNTPIVTKPQIPETQVSALVEALRLAAPKTENPNIYTEWKISSSNIPRWSKQCAGRELPPTEFANNPVLTRRILNCVIRNVLNTQYVASGNIESVAVERAASWWMTGDATRYNNDDISIYTRKVLGLYQQLLSNNPSLVQTPQTTPNTQIQTVQKTPQTTPNTQIQTVQKTPPTFKIPLLPHR